ncbi:MAG: cupin domain-containing protein [Verrucomicrobia bacterium]|nr:cupin domain-containing protein [Verrucomicrobiota bacterium]
MSPIPQSPESGCLPTIRRCFWSAGIQISQLSASRGNQGDPDILEHFVPPRAGPPFYLLEERTEAFYVVQGRFRFRCGANDILMAAGQFLQLPRGLPHLYENVGGDWGRLLNVIAPGGLEPFYVELEAASRSCPVSFDRILQLGSRHGVSILTSQMNCRSDPVT